MKVFISWSGERSRLAAEALKRLLRVTLQATEPFLSGDIEKGKRWSGEIAKALSDCRAGIVCLTKENLTAPWLLFETGAIAKHVDTRTCTFLLDLATKDVGEPLSEFQATQFTKEDVRGLLETVNRLLDAPIAAEVLGDAFDGAWPATEAALTQALNKRLAVDAPPPRSDSEVLNELVARVRDMQTTLTPQALRHQWVHELMSPIELEHIIRQQLALGKRVFASVGVGNLLTAGWVSEVKHIPNGDLGLVVSAEDGQDRFCNTDIMRPVFVVVDGRILALPPWAFRSVPIGPR